MSTVPTAEFDSGRAIGSYRIIQEIGRGGMATVYEATHTVLHRRVALKVMHAELERQPGMVSRMVNEASLFEHVRHPGLVPIYDCNFLPARRPWIAMELVRGESLASEIAKHPLAALDVASLLARVSDLLAVVHAHGIVHRDLKPDNVLLTPRDREYPLRVIDWGVARRAHMGRLTLDGLTPGTPMYMSPEQATGRAIGGACDIFALGVTAFEALSGTPPFDGRTLAEVVALQLAPPPRLRTRCDAPDALCALVHDMLDAEPDRRPTAIEIRGRAHAVARELAGYYASYELRGAQLVLSPAVEHMVDLETLETGVTELVPIVTRSSRWTPEIAFAPQPDDAGVGVGVRVRESR